MLKIILLILIQTGLIFSESFDLKVLMPNVSPKTKDLYLCTKVKLDENEPLYITAFEAHSKKEIAHHILLYGCADPVPEETWNCGEMSHKSSDNDFKVGPVCRSRQNILFAWALDAPKLVLPDDVAFKIGGNTENKYLVMQVHYANVDQFKDGSTDDSGLILKAQTNPVKNLAGVYLFATSGSIQPGTTEYFEAACEMTEDRSIYPFAYRTHAHKLGIVNSGYLVRDDESGEQKWTEIGHRSPQLPQMFFPVTNKLEIKKGDIVAARCTMFNFRNHPVSIGATGEDEMCNFYMMYYVDGERLLKRNTCYTMGPPSWYFKDFKSSTGERLDEDRIPKDISQVPEAQQEELDRMNKSGDMHSMHGNMNMEDSNEKIQESKTDKIISKLIKDYENDLNKDSGSTSDSFEADLEELVKAYKLKKLLKKFGSF